MELNGLRAADHAIIAFIDDGVWIKPTWAWFLTELEPDGSFSVAIVTGGHDEDINEFELFLVRASRFPESAGAPEYETVAAASLAHTGPLYKSSFRPTPRPTTTTTAIEQTTTTAAKTTEIAAAATEAATETATEATAEHSTAALKIPATDTEQPAAAKPLPRTMILTGAAIIAALAAVYGVVLLLRKKSWGLLLFLPLLGFVLLFFLLPAPPPSVLPAAFETQGSAAVEYLKKQVRRYDGVYYVYEDYCAAGNHFNARGKMTSLGGDAYLPDMDENNREYPHSGESAIRCEYTPMGSHWGAWYFMNGRLQNGSMQPNWGVAPEAGVDLSGAQTLTFWARGEHGGEVADFFCFGVGRGSGTPYPDSAEKISLGKILLTNEWKQFSLDVSKADKRYVLGGFGWSVSARDAARPTVLYLDEIRYEWPGYQPRTLPLSYENTAHELKNTAYTYDSAVALIALLKNGQTQDAKRIADAFVYAQNHDRYYTDGRLRNAYQGSAERLPGWYDRDTGLWLEDEFCVSSHTGNMAWAALALLSCYQNEGGNAYLCAAERLAEWVSGNCRDARGAGGFTAGCTGWEPNESKLLYKSTEHNLDLYAVFTRLYRITENEQWKSLADEAKVFVDSMWDPQKGCFYIGTGTDGVTINRGNIPLDSQSWGLLTLKDDAEAYLPALGFAEQHMRLSGGFDFNNDRDGVWYEGTAQMACVYAALGKPEPYLLALLHNAQNRDGGLPAAGRDGLTTGFDLHNGEPWLYGKTPHVGATGWLALAEAQINPFWE